MRRTKSGPKWDELLARELGWDAGDFDRLGRAEMIDYLASKAHLLYVMAGGRSRHLSRQGFRSIVQMWLAENELRH